MLVLAVFLLGLGLGGLTAPQWRTPRRRPVAWAAGGYGIVAVLACGGDQLLALVGPQPLSSGCLLVAIMPGLAAVAMGASFPLLFAAGRPVAAGGLVAANLIGSVAAAALGSNLLLPEVGIGSTVWVGAGAYLCAAASLLPWRLRPNEPSVDPSDRLPAGDARIAFASGFVLLGLEVLLLRRLPFFLEGFQPTLSGVLTACLLAMALGAALGPSLVRARGGGSPASVSILLAAGCVSLGAHEHLAPSLARWPVDSDPGLHVRIVVTVLASAGLPCFLLGAVVPVLLVAAPRANREAWAGRLFCAQGIGSLVGALAVGQLLPAVAPTRLFVLAPAVAGLVAIALCGGRAPRSAIVAAAVVAIGLGGGSGAGSVMAPRPPLSGSRFDRPEAYRYLAHRSDGTVTASVVYDRARHSMALFTDEFRAAYTGPGTSYMRVLGHLPFVLRPEVREVAVVAFGTGTTAAAVAQWPTPGRIDVVEISTAVLSLAHWFAGDGPVPIGRGPTFLADPRTRVHVADGRRWLAGVPTGSLDLLTLEPLLPYAPGTTPLYSREFYALARDRLRPDGLMLQWVPTHALPEEFFATLLSTFADAFAHTSVWLVDQATLLCGSMHPHLPDEGALRERLAALPQAVSLELHEAGLCGVRDFGCAFVGADADVLARFGTAERLSDERPALERIGYWSGVTRLSFYRDNLALLGELAARGEPSFLSVPRAVRTARLDGLAAAAAALLDPTTETAALAVRRLAGARSLVPESVLLHAEETAALRALHERSVVQMEPSAAARIARVHLARDPRSALLQACAGLDDSRDSVGDAGERAIAVDPVFFARAPFLVAGLAPPPPHRSAIEDVGELPPPDGLAALAARRDARGLAFRAAFPVRCARALLGRAARGALDPDEQVALREILDPKSLADVAAAIRDRGGRLVVELPPLWRHDLPIPPALAELGSAADPADRLGLARALAGRRGAAERELLAVLLVDAGLDVRRAAAAALHETARGAVPYDPEWDETRRRAAAELLRTLHNPPR
jgi:spermidine synthase